LLFGYSGREAVSGVRERHAIAEGTIDGHGVVPCDTTIRRMPIVASDFIAELATGREDFRVAEEVECHDGVRRIRDEQILFPRRTAIRCAQNADTVLGGVVGLAHGAAVILGAAADLVEVEAVLIIVHRRPRSATVGGLDNLSLPRADLGLLEVWCRARGERIAVRARRWVAGPCRRDVFSSTTFGPNR